MVHIDEHPDKLRSLSSEELLKLVQDLLQEKPDKLVPNKSRQYIDYNYNDVYVDGQYITVDIRVSIQNAERIISVFERD